MKATVTGLADEGEFIPVLYFANKHHGKINRMIYTIAGVGELVVEFKDKNDAAIFHTIVRQLELGIEWQEGEDES